MCTNEYQSQRNINLIHKKREGVVALPNLYLSTLGLALLLATTALGHKSTSFRLLQTIEKSRFEAVSLVSAHFKGSIADIASLCEDGSIFAYCRFEIASSQPYGIAKINPCINQFAIILLLYFESTPTIFCLNDCIDTNWNISNSLIACTRANSHIEIIN